MLVYHQISSPIGVLCLAATGKGLCRLTWHLAEGEFVTELEADYARSARRIRRDDLRNGGRVAADRTPEGGVAANGADVLLCEAACQLDEYFEGRRRDFSLRLDLTRLRPFQQRVLTALLQVPYGEVTTYGGLAALAGYPGAARAVGGVMRRNPLPLFIPCHRVLPRSGGLGGFAGRPDLKRRLLELEGWTEAAGLPSLPFE